MENNFIEIWKKSRESIEHFDKLLADFRRMIFTVEGIALTVAVTILLSTNDKRLLYVGYLSLGLSIIIMIVWAVEKHYHSYLLASAKVARKVEVLLGLQEEIRLTWQLREAREKQVSFKLFKCHIEFGLYDLMYMVPTLLSLVFSFKVGLHLYAVSVFIMEVVLCIWVTIVHYRNKD